MRAGDRDFHLDDVRQKDDKVRVTYSWSDAEGRRLAWGQVLRLRDGMIVDMEDSRRGSAACRVVRLFAQGPDD